MAPGAVLRKVRRVELGAIAMTAPWRRRVMAIRRLACRAGASANLGAASAGMMEPLAKAWATFKHKIWQASQTCLPDPVGEAFRAGLRD